MTLIWLCCAFLAGIVIADLFGLPVMPCLVIAGTAALLATLWRKASTVLPLALLTALAL